MSQQYKTNYAVTTVTKKQEGNTVRVRISPREGSFAGASDSRSYELRFPAVFPPKCVKVNGKELAYSRFPKAGEWTYDGYTLAPVIYTGHDGLRRSGGDRTRVRRLCDGASGRPVRHERRLQTLSRPDRRIQDRAGRPQRTLSDAARRVPARFAVPQLHPRRARSASPNSSEPMRRTRPHCSKRPIP